MKSWRRRSLAVFTVLGAVLATSLATTGAAPPPADPVPDGPALAKQLVRKTDGANAQRHLRALQRIADANGGNRAAGTPGYDASIDYVAGKLRAAGYEVSTPEFEYENYVVEKATLTVDGKNVPIGAFTYSPSTPPAGLTGPIVVVPEDETPGCEPADYAGVDGKIALTRRGVCTFAEKEAAAADAGASAVLVANNVAGPLVGTLGEAGAGRIPIAGLSKADGDRLAAAPGKSATMTLLAETVRSTSRNVLAQTRTGNTQDVLMAGGHLDGVPEGAGINDNGTGTAALLETALRLGGAPKAKHAVRFAFWGAEELGLLGSTAYVNGLSTEERLDIAAYLNFDMVGSPNAGYFAYDGDDSAGEGAGAGPYGSAQLEKTFVDFMAFRGIELDAKDFDGRSDYGPFIAAGIPAGGVHTGTGDVTMTKAQAKKWGGTAGKPFDACYHKACDNLGNVNAKAFDRNTDAIAWAIGSYATSTASLGPGKRAAAPPAEPRPQHAAAR